MGKEKTETAQTVKITIPTHIEVPVELVEGDASSSVRFEVKSSEGYTPYIDGLLQRGARVFMDEDDCFLIVHSPDSLTWRNSLDHKQ